MHNVKVSEYQCLKCGGPMERGIAIENTYVPGLPDFIGDEHSCTYSVGGDGKVIEVGKCINCGHSVTL